VATREFTFANLKDILVNRIGLPDESVVDDREATFDDMGLDSLAFIEIQLAMQQEYGFTIPDEDADDIHNVGQAIDYVNQRLSGQE
jgi:acyl carrier protein